MGKAKDSDTLGIHVRKDIIAEIVRRGDALGLKKGTYAAMILEKWAADGFPAVSEPDRLMQMMRAREKADADTLGKLSRSPRAAC